MNDTLHANQLHTFVLQIAHIKYLYYQTIEVKEQNIS